MNARGFWLVLLTLCVVGGLIAAVFTPAIAATLTLPATSNAVRAVVTPRPRPTPTATGVTQARPTMLANGLTVLAHDTFQRPDQRFWGSASDGRVWGGDANANPAFSIKNGVGQIAGGSGPLQATLNVTSTDAEILLSGSVNHFDAHGGINLGGVLRWRDAHNWYKVLINGNILQLLKAVDGKITVLGSTPFQAVGNTSYSLRLRVLGSNLFAKAWPAAHAEPANWALMVIDTQLSAGVGGMRVLLAPGAVIRVTSFLETNVPAPV
jgi:hypothetical protein